MGSWVLPKGKRQFTTSTVIDWVDLFTRPIYKHIVIDALEYCIKNKGLTIHAYVIMPNHIHLIAGAGEEYRLQDITRDFKKYTSKKLIEVIKENPEGRSKWLLKKFSYAANRVIRGSNYKIWKDACLPARQGFHPIELSNREILEQKLIYIHENPVKEEWVINEEDYKYSSAINYAGGIGQLPVEIIE